MLKNLLYILFCLGAKTTVSQTLINVTSQYINNPSFEDYTSCPQANSSYPNGMWIDSCKHWTAPTIGTSDYFNACNTSGSNSVPKNYLAYQPAYSGNSYCGFLAYSVDYTVNPPKLWCEYLQTKLKQKLIGGEKYNFSMRINRCDGFNFSVKQIGVHFSKDSLRDKTTTVPYNFTPTVLNNTGFLNDTLDWTLVTGNFIANGGEEYLTIGWFGDTITSDYSFFIPPDTVPITGELLYLTESYYFVDSLNLSIVKYNDINTATDFNEYNINIITPNNDGVNDVIDFSKYQLNEFEINIYNRWGNKVFWSKDTKLKWNGYNKNQTPLTDGAYYYILNCKNSYDNIVTKNGYLTIIN